MLPLPTHNLLSERCDKPVEGRQFLQVPSLFSGVVGESASVYAIKLLVEPDSVVTGKV